MASLDPVIFRELSVIEKIVRDETWLEGERRGCWVSSDDPVVRENICRVILRIGEELRAMFMAEISGEQGSSLRPIPGSDDRRAA